jgi:hypothetical protein
MEHFTGRASKRACKAGDYPARSLDVCSSVAVVARARVTPVKEIQAQMTMLIHDQLRMIDASDLAKALDAKSLCLVGDGESFEVMNKW